MFEISYIQSHEKKQKEKDKGADALWLVHGRSSSGRIKRHKKSHCSVGVKKAELLPGNPEFRMKSLSFRRIKDSFGIVEKALVVVYGLPVLDHSAVPPCNWLG